MTIRGIGIDVAEVKRFRVLYQRYGERFARKWFTDDEVRRCVGDPDPGAALAEHFAAKEAVWKALGSSRWLEPPPWRSIEYRAPEGAAVLRGLVARRAGDVDVHVSVARQRGIAVATALVSTVATTASRLTARG